MGSRFCCLFAIRGRVCTCWRCGSSRGERAAWEVKLAAAGHPAVAETGFTFYVRDPEGNRIGFSHHPLPRT